MKKILFLLFISIVILEAKGVRAGTVISNQALLNFSVGDGFSYTIKSNEVKNIVSQVINFVLNWQDTKPVKIYPGAEKKVLTLSLKNEGNGKDDISVNYFEDSSFSQNIKSIKLYKDENKNGLFDSEDRVFDHVELEPDKKIDFFVVTSLKDSIDSLSKKLEISIEAKSNIGGSGVKGRVYKGRGENGVDAIDGVNGGIYKKIVFYNFIKDETTLKKEVVYFKKKRYFLVSLYLNFNSTNLKQIHLSDRVPRGLYYRKNSIKVDHKYQSDKKDGDMASFDFNINTLHVDIKNLQKPKKILVTYILDRRQ